MEPPAVLQVCTTPKCKCIRIKKTAQDAHNGHLTTYYLIAFLFPRSFRGFWLNAK